MKFAVLVEKLVEVNIVKYPTMGYGERIMTEPTAESPIPSQELKSIKSHEGFLVSLSQEVNKVDLKRPALALLLVENPTNADQALEAARRVSSPMDIIGTLGEGSYEIVTINTQPMEAVQKALRLSDISPDSLIGVRIFHKTADADSVSGFYNRATKALDEAKTSKKIVISVYNTQQVPIKEFTPQDQTRLKVTSAHK